MRKNVKIKFFDSYESAQEDLDRETFDMVPTDRVSTTEHLRRQMFLIKGRTVDLSMKKVITFHKIV